MKKTTPSAVELTSVEFYSIGTLHFASSVVFVHILGGKQQQRWQRPEISVYWLSLETHNQTETRAQQTLEWILAPSTVFCVASKGILLFWQTWKTKLRIKFCFRQKQKHKYFSKQRTHSLEQQAQGFIISAHQADMFFPTQYTHHHHQEQHVVSKTQKSWRKPFTRALNSGSP